MVPYGRLSNRQPQLAFESTQAQHNVEDMSHPQGAVRVFDYVSMIDILHASQFMPSSGHEGSVSASASASIITGSRRQYPSHYGALRHLARVVLVARCQLTCKAGVKRRESCSDT